MSFYGANYKMMQKIQILKSLRGPSTVYEIWEYAFKYCHPYQKAPLQNDTHFIGNSRRR